MPVYSAAAREQLLNTCDQLAAERLRLRKLAWDSHCQTRQESDDMFFKMWALTPDGVRHKELMKTEKRILKRLAII
jgi:hypothetical protein